MSERDVEVLFLDHLDRRRTELAAAMWQAPALTIAAQAFLLIVLTDEGVSAWARAVVLVAGVAATLAAIGALLRLRQREVLYSDAIAFYGERIGMRDLRPDDLERKPLQREGRWARLDERTQAWAGQRSFPPIHYAWTIALLLFAVADAVAFALHDLAGSREGAGNLKRRRRRAGARLPSRWREDILMTVGIVYLTQGHNPVRLLYVGVSGQEFWTSRPLLWPYPQPFWGRASASSLRSSGRLPSCVVGPFRRSLRG